MLSQLSGTNLFTVFILILFAVATHEAMHAFTAHWLGDDTAYMEGRLTLNPFKHVDLYTTILLPLLLIAFGLPPFFIAKPVPFNPDRVKFDEFGAALVGIAGPFTNLIMAGVAALFLRIFGADIAGSIVNILVIFVSLNVALFVFNMIPFPPLDGSRLLYALAPEPVQRIMYQIESGGLVTILVFMFLLFPLVGPIIVNIDNTIIRFLLGG